jgi:hypothetical protein
MKYRIIALGLSLFLYGIALTLPCLLFEIVPRELSIDHLKDYGSFYEMNGLEVTGWGILGLLFLQIPALGWLANPVYWLSCIFFVRQQYKFSAIGFGGTLSAFWFNLPNGSNLFSVLALHKLLAGFWVWLSAPGLLGLISVFYLVKMTQYPEN